MQSYISNNSKIKRSVKDGLVTEYGSKKRQLRRVLKGLKKKSENRRWDTREKNKKKIDWLVNKNTIKYT